MTSHIISLQEHYEEYYEMYGETQFNFGNLFAILITNLRSEEDVKRAKKFFSTVDLGRVQQPTDTSKQPIRTRYLGHVPGY